jgi:hypothetical protein
MKGALGVAAQVKVVTASSLLEIFAVHLPILVLVSVDYVIATEITATARGLFARVLAVAARTVAVAIPLFAVLVIPFPVVLVTLLGVVKAVEFLEIPAVVVTFVVVTFVVVTFVVVTFVVFVVVVFVVPGSSHVLAIFGVGTLGGSFTGFILVTLVIATGRRGT